MTLSEDQCRVAHQVASLLLSYPDEALIARLPLLRRAAAGLPAPVAAPLGRALDYLAATPLGQLAAGYVETFDLQRKSSLYLTYALYGDTRKRGAALLRFKRAYRAGGMELAGGELPDHLAVVLEFSARGHTGAAVRLLAEHRAALELCWHALREAGSPYADVLAAVRATLPEPGPRDLAAALRLAREGPPAEEVGLEPYPMAMHPATPPPASPEPPGGRR